MYFAFIQSSKLTDFDFDGSLHNKLRQVVVAGSFEPRTESWPDFVLDVVDVQLCERACIPQAVEEGHLVRDTGIDLLKVAVYTNLACEHSKFCYLVLIQHSKSTPTDRIDLKQSK